MKIWKMLSLVFLLAACTGGTSETQSTANLTLQVIKKDNQRAALVLCQGNTCQNPLQNTDGSEFYFQNHAETYNKATRGLTKGKAVTLALVGVSVLAGMAGVYYMFRHLDWTKKIDNIDARLGGENVAEVRKAEDLELTEALKDSARDLDKFEATVLDKTGQQVTIKKTGVDKNGDAILTVSRDSDDAADVGNAAADDVGDELKPEDYVLLRKERDDILKQSKVAQRNKELSFAAGGASLMASVIPTLTIDRHWKHKRRTFEQLFIHGNRVTVSQAETRALLEVITSSMPAIVVTPQVKNDLLME